MVHTWAEIEKEFHKMKQTSSTTLGFLPSHLLGEISPTKYDALVRMLANAKSPQELNLIKTEIRAALSGETNYINLLRQQQGMRPIKPSQINARINTIRQKVGLEPLRAKLRPITKTEQRERAMLVKKIGRAMLKGSARTYGVKRPQQYVRKVLGAKRRKT